MRFKVAATLLVVANLIVLGYTLSVFGVFTTSSGPANVDPSHWHVQHGVRVGGTIDPLALARLSGHAERPWTHLLLLIADVNYQDAGLGYLAPLRDKYSSLECLVVADGTEDVLREYLREMDADLPHVADPDGAMRRALGFSTEDDQRGVLLIDDQGEIQFFAPYVLRPDYLRQLVEKHLNEEVDFAFRADDFSTLFREGSSMPALNLRPAYGDDAEAEVTRPRLTLFITPSAQTCRLQGFLEQAHTLSAAAAAEGRDFQVVFGTQFSRPYLGNKVQQGELPRQTYLLRVNNPIFSDYKTRTERSAPDMIAVRTDELGKVSQVAYPAILSDAQPQPDQLWSPLPAAEESSR